MGTWRVTFWQLRGGDENFGNVCTFELKQSCLERLFGEYFRNFLALVSLFHVFSFCAHANSVETPPFVSCWSSVLWLLPEYVPSKFIPYKNEKSTVLLKVTLLQWFLQTWKQFSRGVEQQRPGQTWEMCGFFEYKILLTQSCSFHFCSRHTACSLLTLTHTQYCASHLFCNLCSHT